MSFRIHLVSFLLLVGCGASNNPALLLASSGTTSVSLTVAQIDTTESPHNRIFVSVVDQSDNPIRDFRLGNFVIAENGRAGVPFEVGNVSDPLTVMLVLDRSGSMGGARETGLEAAAQNFVNALANNDYVGIVDFASSASVVQDFTNDKSILNAKISASTSSGSTALYEGMKLGAEVLSGRKGRKMLLVITDGDNTVTGVSQEEAIQTANRAGLSAYVVGIGVGAGLSTETIRALSEGTGATYFTSADASDLDPIFTEMISRFNNLVYIKYRRRSEGGITVYLNYPPLGTSGRKPFI